ncbi:transposase [Reichenbachiella agarivorans]|uniref:Transposase n=1 Tax=Reichenbachiella agarivorans TaxID=2979464 RepID=A0ABY6CT27_9BACT|nr:transposase [Reichenbachiella agarivorans]UXP33667.1 transposase [Reichenbachiella agarivorans]
MPACRQTGVDVFTRDAYRQIVIDSLSYCQKEKELVIHAWVLMSNHMHMIISRSDTGASFSHIVRDFKKYCSSQIIRSIEGNTEKVGEIACLSADRDVMDF